MRMKAAFEDTDGIVKVKKNNLNAIRTNRPHDFKRESDEFRKKTSKEKALMTASGPSRDVRMTMLLTGYEE